MILRVGKQEYSGSQYAEESQGLQGDKRLKLPFDDGNFQVVRRHSFSVRKVRTIRSVALAPTM